MNLRLASYLHPILCATGGGADDGGSEAGAGSVETDHLRVESEVRRDDGGGLESGQGDAESGDCKKPVELVERKVEARWLWEKFLVSRRRICELLGVAETKGAGLSELRGSDRLTRYD